MTAVQLPSCMVFMQKSPRHPSFKTSWSLLNKEFMEAVILKKTHPLFCSRDERLAAARAGIESKTRQERVSMLRVFAFVQSTGSEQHRQLASYKYFCWRKWVSAHWRKQNMSHISLKKELHLAISNSLLNLVEWACSFCNLKVNHAWLHAIPAGPCSPGAPWAGTAPISNEASGAVPPIPWGWRCDMEAGAVSNWTWHRQI